MTDFSLAERFKTIFNLVSSQSFFITLFVILVLTIAILVINIKVKSRAPKYAALLVYVGLAVLVIARYGKYVLSFNDSVVDKFFKALYFPNLVVYLSMLVITLLLLTISLIDRKFSTFTKICNYLCFFVIWFLFVLVVDTIKREGLNFYEVVEIYANKTVMILLQTSMYIFVIWMGILISDLIVRTITKKLDNKDKTVVNNDINSNIVNTSSYFKKKTIDDQLDDYTLRGINYNPIKTSEIALNDDSDSIEKL